MNTAFFKDVIESRLLIVIMVQMEAGYAASVENVIKNLNISLEQACRIIGISLEYYNEAIKRK